MNKKMLFLFVFLFHYHVSFCTGNNPRIIVKFQPEINYKIDHRNNIVTTSNNTLALLLNNSHITKIVSLVADVQLLKSSVKSLDIIQHIHIFEIDSAYNKIAIIKKLNQSAMFEYVEDDVEGTGGGSNAVIPNDTYFYRQWSLENNGSFNSNAIAGADVNMTNAWSISTGSSSTVVCILDTGLKLDHPEFNGRLWSNTAEIAGNNIDDDANGYVDDVNGWDWAYSDNNPTDDFGHGTNVAGILAANGNNGIGYAGVNWKCKVMIGKILNSNNSGFYSWWISGITYAVLNGAKIINMSVGGNGFSQALKDACDFAYANQVAIFACMMNFNNSVTYYPAGFSSTIAIGATDVNDYRAVPFFWSNTSGSNYGAHIDLVAPGNYMYGLAYNSNTNYDSYWGGTSQATPLVAGVGSLICALKPTATVEEIRNILMATAKDLVGNPAEDITGWDQYMGAGRMDAAVALRDIYPCAGSAITFVSTLSGTNYQWQQNDGNGFIDITNNSNYNGTNSPTLQLNNAPNSWYGYQYRCVADGNISTAFVLRFINYWIGSTNAAWENPANWSCGSIPDLNMDVVINNGNPHLPEISSAANCRSTTITNGVLIKINTGYTLSITQ